MSNYINVSVATLPSKLVINHIDELINMLEDLGVFDFRMQPLMLLGRARSEMEDISLNGSEYIKLSRYLEKETLDRINSNRMQVEWGDPIMHLYSFMDKPLSYLYINAYGQIMISPYLPIVVGDLRKHDLSYYFKHGLLDIWYDDKIKYLASKISSPDSMDVFKSDDKEIFTDHDYIMEL